MGTSLKSHRSANKSCNEHQKHCSLECFHAYIILKLNAKQVSDETVLACIPSFKQMLPIFSDRCSICTLSLTLSCFNISLMKFKLLLSLYYLLTSFLHIGYLEKHVTVRIYPRSSFVLLPTFTDVWNWALGPRHPDCTPKIRQISFTNVTLENLCIVILNHPIFCTCRA